MDALSEATNDAHPVKHPEDVSHLRRVVSAVARSAGASEAEECRAALAVTELATNLLRHAERGGSILLRRLVTGGCRGLEFLSVDKGPGMNAAGFHSAPGLGSVGPGDAEKAWAGGRAGLGVVLQNEAETPRIWGRGGLGVGLASVQRLSTRFDIYSRPDKGTVVLSRHYFGDAPKPGVLEVGGVNTARPGESVSGDGWAVSASRTQLSALLVDGLGHGPDAGKAAETAIHVLKDRYFGDVEDYVRQANTAMLPTRGAVLALARIDPAVDQLQYVGVGNIEGRLFVANRGTALTSRNGIVGVTMSPPPTRLVVHPWTPGSTLILNSDGISLKLDALTRNGLLQHDPAVIAAVALRDGARGTDDATVVVIKDTRGTSP